MGASGEELMDTEMVFPEEPLETDALHAEFTVEFCRAKETLVSDSALGSGPGGRDTDMEVRGPGVADWRVDPSSLV